MSTQSLTEEENLITFFIAEKNNKILYAFDSTPATAIAVHTNLFYYAFSFIEHGFFITPF